MIPFLKIKKKKNIWYVPLLVANQFYEYNFPFQFKDYFLSCETMHQFEVNMQIFQLIGQPTQQKKLDVVSFATIKKSYKKFFEHLDAPETDVFFGKFGEKFEDKKKGLETYAFNPKTGNIPTNSMCNTTLQENETQINSNLQQRNDLSDASKSDFKPLSDSQPEVSYTSTERWQRFQKRIKTGFQRQAEGKISLKKYYESTGTLAGRYGRSDL